MGREARRRHYSHGSSLRLGAGHGLAAGARNPRGWGHPTHDTRHATAARASEVQLRSRTPPGVRPANGRSTAGLLHPGGVSAGPR